MVCAQEFGDGKKAAFAEERFELADDGEEGDEVDGGHAALEKQASEDEVAEVVVDRGHSSSSERLDERSSDCAAWVVVSHRSHMKAQSPTQETGQSGTGVMACENVKNC